MMKNKLKNKLKNFLKFLKEKDLYLSVFVITNTINGILLRLITIKNGLRLSAVFVDAGVLLIFALFTFLIKKEKSRKKYLMILTSLMTLICFANSAYYHYYSSFTSVSLLATTVFVKDVSDAVFENILKPIDIIYFWQPIFFYIYIHKRKLNNRTKKEEKKISKIGVILSVSIISIGICIMPSNAFSRLYKLWNRESVVINFGPYVYQIDDIIQSLTPGISSIFGHDSAYRKVKEYYEKNKTLKTNNEFTDIFKGKNIIVIHAESIQSFTMNLEFNDKEVTPNLNKLANEGIFFNNFYSQVGVGTSSDAEFTFNTSLMPSNRGTVFVNYYDRKYVTIPQLLKEKGYYAYSMHGNKGDFWNRNIMHKTLGYDRFYSEDSYIIDEKIGLGLSDKSFFRQSIDIMKKMKEENNGPFYSLLIMLSNHTPFSDLELTEEYPTTTNVTINNETITRNYINNTRLGNYIRSVHYADAAIGEFVEKLEESGLLENSILVIYGDHDARLDINEYNLLYNYDPINDKIKTELDEGYINFNEYEYELNRKVPFIIWTKEKNFNIKINTPTGMIDVLPTLGNMIGIKSKYALGNDIMNIKDGDNLVTFSDGSFVTSKIYYNAPKGEIYMINNDPITEEYIDLRVNHSAELIEISNDIIYYDLIKELDVSN